MPAIEGSSEAEDEKILSIFDNPYQIHTEQGRSSRFNACEPPGTDEKEKP
jgi:hypothetical protein